MIFRIGSAERKEGVCYSSFCPEGARGVKTVILGKGSKWYDCLNPESSNLPLLVSSRVIESLLELDVAGLRWDKVEFESSMVNRRARKAPMDYFSVAPKFRTLKIKFRVFEYLEGRMEFRFESEDLNNDCRSDDFFTPDGFIPQIQRLPVDPLPVVGEFFCVPGFEQGTFRDGSFYCTEKILEAARASNWSNFTFNPIDSLTHFIGDFRNRDGSPKSWYSRRDRLIQE